MQKVEVVDAVKRKAICNDGSPAVYYFEPGYGDGAKRWVISLRGGWYCNAAPCSGRPSYLMTSLDSPEIWVAPEGLLSNDSIQNPDFYNANHVMIHYCSSDLWSGNKTRPGPQGPFHFRGRKIFRSVIRDLMNKSAPNLTEQGTEILLQGGSAGGVGVMVNLDWLAEQLPSAKVRGFNDGGWIPFETRFTSFIEESIFKGVRTWKGGPDKDCAIANRKNKSSCYISTVLPYLKTPIFVQQSQRDPFFPYAWLDHTPPHIYPSPSENAKAVRTSLLPAPAAFSPKTRTHVLSGDSNFLSIRVNGYSLAQLLGNWFFDRAGPVKMIKN